MTFGGNNEQNSTKRVEVGVNEGFNMTGFAELYDGGTWKGFKTIFEGSIPVNHMLFIPTRRPENQQALDGYNKRQKDYNDRKKKSHADLTMSEWLDVKFDEDVDAFIRTLNMYAYSFHGQNSEELKTRIEKLPTYPSAQAILDDIDNYITQLHTIFFPSDFQSYEWDILLGKSEGDQYLNPPRNIQITGRFAKLTKDDTRGITVNDYFDRTFIEPTQLKESTPSQAAETAVAHSWTTTSE